MRMYTNDGDHRLSRMLLSGTASTFESSLLFTSNPYPSDTGERVCIATATYVSVNSSETNISTAVGKLINKCSHFPRLHPALLFHTKTGEPGIYNHIKCCITN